MSQEKKYHPTNNLWIFHRFSGFPRKTKKIFRDKEDVRWGVFSLQLGLDPADADHFLTKFPLLYLIVTHQGRHYFPDPPRSPRVPVLFTNSVCAIPNQSYFFVAPQLSIPMFSSLRHITLFGLFATRPLSMTPPPPLPLFLYVC